MPELYLYTFASVALVSALSFIGVIGLALSDRLLRKTIFLLVSLAVGALLGDALLHLIPEAFAETSNPLQTGLLILAGILFFFVIEKVLHWHHYHGDHEHDTQEKHADHQHLAGHRIHPTGFMILLSDGVHNFIDGVIIAVSFLASPAVGIASTIAIILHEIPQEIGDFGVLLHAGFSKTKALILNFASAILAVLGAAAALAFSGMIENTVALILPIAAGGFLYIANADLIPELHKVTMRSKSALQVLMIVLGIGAILALIPLEERLGIAHEHGAEEAHEEAEAH